MLLLPFPGVGAAIFGNRIGQLLLVAAATAAGGALGARTVKQRIAVACGVGLLVAFLLALTLLMLRMPPYHFGDPITALVLLGAVSVTAWGLVARGERQRVLIAAVSPLLCVGLLSVVLRELPGLRALDRITTAVRRDGCDSASVRRLVEQASDYVIVHCEEPAPFIAGPACGGFGYWTVGSDGIWWCAGT